MVGLTNYITGDYERKLKSARSANTELAAVKKNLSKVKEEFTHLERITLERGRINSDLTDKLAALIVDKDRVVVDLISANARVDGLAAEKNSMEERLKSETRRLQNSRDEMVHREKIRVREEVAAKCASRLEKLKKHLAGRDAQDKVLLILIKVSGTYDYLKVLKGQGMLVPEAIIEKLVPDKAKWKADLNALDVVDLEAGDLEMTHPPSRFPKDVAVNLPAGVDQHRSNARAISPADAADLRDNLNT